MNTAQPELRGNFKGSWRTHTPPFSFRQTPLFCCVRKKIGKTTKEISVKYHVYQNIFYNIIGFQGNQSAEIFGG